MSSSLEQSFQLPMFQQTFDQVAANIPLSVEPESFNIGGFGLNEVSSLAGALGGIISARDRKKYNNELLGMEKSRIARAQNRQDAYDSAFKKAYQ